MRRISLLAVALAWAAYPVTAQQPATATKPGTGELTDPIEILKKVDEATKAVKSVKYTATGKGIGADEARVPSVEGTVILLGTKNNQPEKYRYEIKVRMPGSEDLREVVIGSDGDKHFLIDSAKKIAYVDIDPAVIGSAGPFRRVITMLEYVHATPFSDEINAKKQELKGSAKVGNEECYEIHVVYGTQNQEANWFFSKKDFLPRRVDRKFPGREGGGIGGTQLIVTSLTPDPKLDKEDPFTFVLPEGYTQSDDFAP